MTFVWKDKALRAAGKRGVAKARAYGLATNRRVPITLAKVRWLERPIIPASERELTGKPPAGEAGLKPAGARLGVLDGCEHGARMNYRRRVHGLGTVRNPRFIWSAYARVAQGFVRTNI